MRLLAERSETDDLLGLRRGESFLACCAASHRHIGLDGHTVMAINVATKLRPDLAQVRPTVRSLARACAAAAIAAIDRVPPLRVVGREWPRDGDAELFTRAASSIIDMASADALTHSVTTDFIATLGAQSVAARLFREGLQLQFGNDGKISAPTLIGDPSRAGFVADGFPIPVVQSDTEPLLFLTPKKLAAIVVLTSEMVRSSNIETLVLDALTRSSALALDAALLDDQPASNARPAGLRYGVVPLAASSAPDPVSAVVEDIEHLYEAVEPVASRHPVLVTSVARTLTFGLMLTNAADLLTTMGSYALRGSKDLIAVVPATLVSVFGAIPEISASRENSLNMDTAPALDLMTDGRTSSIWQADCVALKLRLPVTWGLRAAGVSWLTALNW
jgi:hypothetical protein